MATGSHDRSQMSVIDKGNIGALIVPQMWGRGICMIGLRRMLRAQAGQWRRRHWTTRLPLLLLCLAAAGAWAVQFDGLGDARKMTKPTVLRRGETWRGKASNPRQGQVAGVLSGRVTHVRDGDTIEISGTPVRIANLDCAERGTSAGDRATRRMRELARQSPMRCRMNGQRSYDREIGT